jgi:dipeptide transport system ATP-binding protein
MPLLDIRNLTVTFATPRGAFTAVDGVDVTLNRNDVLAIVGESGSGKSVVMLAVMGLLPPTATVTADRIAFDSADLMAMSMSQRRRLAGREMAMIFQKPMSSLNPCFTVGFQIGEALKAHLGFDRKAREKRIVELLAEVGIPDPVRRARAFPHRLSGSMSQRVMIAMALACRPKLLIADEPTTAFDVTIQAQILDLLLELRRENGMGLVLITHDMGVVAETRRPRHRPICGPAGRGQRNARTVRRCASSLYRRASGGVARAGERSAPARDSGCCAGAVRPAARLRVLAALRLRLRRLP